MKIKNVILNRLGLVCDVCACNSLPCAERLYFITKQKILNCEFVNKKFPMVRAVAHLVYESSL